MKKACLVLVPLLLARSDVAQGEVVDRIAVTVDKRVIAESDLILDLRVSAFWIARPSI